ncbi:MAG: translocation/assembly module TamB domain-containing protein [Primorskyibacter sp.]
MALRDLEADVTLGAGRAQIALTTALEAGGTLALSGPVALSPPFDGALEVRVRDIVLSEPGFYDTTVAGTVRVTGPLQGGAVIGGALALGPVELRLPDGTSADMAGLPGLQHVNDSRAVRLTRQRAGVRDTSANGSTVMARPYPLDLEVSAPARIFVRGRGLDAELGGAVRLRGTTAEVQPDGQFDLVRGRLDILGKRLTLTEAQARLRGGFDPDLRLVAGFDAQDTAIEIIIEGPVSDLSLSLNATPSLPEDEILAKLLFGRSLSQISAFQAVQMAAAVRTLAGGGGDGILERLRGGLGVDDLDITTDEDTQSGLIVIDRNANDGAEVTHFKISGISGGTLYQADGTTSGGFR